MNEPRSSNDSKVAVVTGASRGIGAGLVRAFRDRNYAVVANARSIDPSTDPGILTIAGDISKPETAEQIVDETMQRFGRIDTLVNNAGTFIGKAFGDYTEDDFVRALATNVAGFFHITQRVLAQMALQGSGAVVTISAGVADHPIAKQPSALASLTKGGLNSVTKALAIEYAARGIRVNAIAPGIIKTPEYPAESYEGLAQYLPLNRLGNVSDIVEAVMYLEAAPFVTGQILYVDGGLSAE